MFVCTEVSPSSDRELPLLRSDRDEATRDILATQLDDRSLRYLVDMLPAFEALRTVASQLAGLLVLVAAGAKGGAPDLALLDAASLTYAEALDKFRGLTASPGVLHVHHHLREAAEGIGSALAEVDRQAKSPTGAFEVDGALALLRPAYRQLQFASRLAPGYRLVETRDACCGFAHRG